MNKNNSSRFYLLLLTAMLLWAGSWVSGRLLSVQGNPLIIMFWRFLFTFVSFLPFLIVKRKEIRNIDIPSFFYTLAGAALICLYNLSFLSGLKASLAGKGGVLVTTANPLFAFIIGIVFFRKSAGREQLFGLLLGLGGGFILVEPWTWQQGVLMDWTNLIFLGAALCWALLSYMSQFAQRTMDPFIFNPLLYLLASGLSFLILPDKWLEASGAFPPSVWVNILYLAVGAGAVGAGVYFFATTKLGAAKASTMTFLVPVLALFLGWLLLHEQIQWQTLLGGSLSILALLIIHGRIRIRLFQTSC